jgi:hypothetical protein
VKNYVLGEFYDFTLNCEENNLGEFKLAIFFGVWSGIHVALMRRGGPCMRFGGIYCAPIGEIRSSVIFKWGDL